MKDVLDWPASADGDVFRRLESRGFDFSQRHRIDFIVDFPTQLPGVDALDKLRQLNLSFEIFDEEPLSDNASAFRVVIYDFVRYKQSWRSNLVSRI